MNHTVTNIDQHMPELLRHFEVYLRSGYNIKQALNIIASDVKGPLGEQAQLVVEDLEAGQTLETVLDNWFKRTPNPDLNLVLAAIHVQREVGGNLADKFQLLGQIMAKRRQF